MNKTTTRMMGSNSVIMIVVRDGREFGRTRNERSARAMARQSLGCCRVSEYASVDGWTYYPTGDTSEDGPSVRVVVTGNPNCCV
jgi:hypothetical protein